MDNNVYMKKLDVQKNPKSNENRLNLFLRLYNLERKLMMRSLFNENRFLNDTMFKNIFGDIEPNGGMVGN